MSRWNERDDVLRGDDYDARWKRLAAEGKSIHGEADCLCGLRPSGSVLDAGCGTGRVAIEMAARGYDVTGVDLDPGMLDTARAKAPEVEWHLADLLHVDLGRRFDLVALPGNVMIFVAPGTEAAVVANLERHLAPDGLLVAGFQLGPGKLTLADYDAHCDAAGLELAERWSTWDGEPFDPADAGYAVSVHRHATVTG
ncbi:MAG: class I SAM-dependent methyltransferase [Actinomycetota bacterium]